MARSARTASPTTQNPAPRLRRLRLYETVRTAHLERAHTLTPASILYGRRRYDFDDEVAKGLDLHQVSLPGLVRVLWSSPVAAIEVNEPLMTSGLRRAALAVAATRARGRPGHVQVVTYAIENRDPAGSTSPRAGGAAHGVGGVVRAVRRRARVLADAALRRYVWRRLDRVAFGTAAAQELYARLLPATGPGVETALIPALPAPCSCAAGAAADPARVLFVGAFTVRKGFPLLMEAWPHVVAQRPDARLGLVGKGPLEDLARERAAGDPTVSLDVDPPRDRIHEHLRRATILVLPSQPTSTWREQVGLPIIEGLSHGCAVVTTTETGLASWLERHGHTVIGAGGSPHELADAVIAALDASRSATSVLADLPEVDGRLAADRWLFADTTPAQARRPG
jgi:glycosyltransferase involved in cell wall biosynthesis